MLQPGRSFGFRFGFIDLISEGRGAPEGGFAPV